MDLLYHLQTFYTYHILHGECLWKVERVYVEELVRYGACSPLRENVVSSACSGSRFDLDRRALRSELFVSDGMLVTYHMAILLRRMGVAEVRTKRRF